MNSAKKSVGPIAEICRRNGISKVVFSPGSRSAPLVIAFSQIPEIECIVIPDERVAGYFALGMAQQTGKTVAVVCTSGTAVLNLGPAICEAFYQHVPILLLSADRPKGAVEKGENQAIDQAFVFRNFTKLSLDLNGDEMDIEQLVQMAPQVEMALTTARTPAKGPVHVNIRLSEPLYGMSDELPVLNYRAAETKPRSIEQTVEHGSDSFADEIKNAGRKLIIIGLKNGSPAFDKNLEALALRNDVAVLAEATSNVPGNENVIYNYDACLDLASTDELNFLAPDIVITAGNQIISKRIKQFLRLNKPKSHWHISTVGESSGYDLFDVGVHGNLREQDAFNCLAESAEVKNSDYKLHWKNLHQKSIELTEHYLAKVEFSDLKVFEILIKSFPEESNIQYGNSTPIRYSSIFRHGGYLSVNSNRGTSGIDGCVSTAAGAAYVNAGLTICLVGDITFFYDSNALFNNYLSPKLRIIVMNNSGGNIFRLIEGPSKVPGFEKFFETGHGLTANHLAGMYNIPYYYCTKQNELENILKSFYGAQNGKPAILEIKTNNEVNARVYKEYFNFLKHNSLKHSTN